MELRGRGGMWGTQLTSFTGSEVTTSCFSPWPGPRTPVALDFFYLPLCSEEPTAVLGPRAFRGWGPLAWGLAVPLAGH